MAYELLNKLQGRSVLRVVGAGTVTVVPSAFVAANSSNETVTSVAISRVWWSTNNNITIARGATTVLSLYTSGLMLFADSGVSVANSGTANVVVTITGDGSCVLECTKEVTYTNPV